MKGSRIGLAVLLLGLTGTVGLGATLEIRRDVEQMADAARSFLASLSDEQQARATFAFDSDERGRFSYVSAEMFQRHGVMLKEMNSEQRDRAHELLRAGLSQRGYMTANEIREVEGILRDMEARGYPPPCPGCGGRRRDPDEYFLAVFGTPSTDGTWGWQFEGHHLSLIFTIVEGNITVSTPTFLGAHPAEVPEGPRRGLRPLGDQEDAARALLASLDAEQRDVAILEEVVPTSVVTGTALEVDPLSPVGIQASALSNEQRGLLMALIESYTSVMAVDIAALRTVKVREGGVENIAFAWIGGTERGEVAYYRVQGPTFVIEFDNALNEPNHVHTVWRDFDGDLGRDLLREHLERDH